MSQFNEQELDQALSRIMFVGWPITRFRLARLAGVTSSEAAKYLRDKGIETVGRTNDRLFRATIEVMEREGMKLTARSIAKQSGLKLSAAKSRLKRMQTGLWR
jgi:hypothetical protein